MPRISLSATDIVRVVNALEQAAKEADESATATEIRDYRAAHETSARLSRDLVARIAQEVRNQEIKNETTKGDCGICTDRSAVRHLPIYVRGSEGLAVCHACEMDLVNHLRALIGVHARTMKASHIRSRRTTDLGALFQEGACIVPLAG